MPRATEPESPATAPVAAATAEAEAEIARAANGDAPPRRRFLLVFLAWNVLWWSVIGAFAAPVVPGGWFAVTGATGLALLPLVALTRVIDGSLYPSAALRVGVLRPFWYVQLALPLVALVAIIGALAGLPFGAWRIAGLRALAGAALAFAVFAVAGYAGSRRLVARHYDAAFEDLPEGLDGLRIAQVSDLHVGPHTPRGHLRRIVDAVRAAEPDLVAITGDQVDDHDHDVAHFARAFGALRAPLGVYAIPGNHDVYAGWDGVRRGLEQMGVTVLVNAAVPVERYGARFWVAGTGDPAGRYWHAEGGAAAAPDVDRTLARIPRGAFTLALAHNPALWPALAERGVALTLSGHTHHGQLSVPALNWCLASPFLEHAMGAHQRGASLLYINPGTNYWGVPFRLGAWPEVTIVTLRRGNTGLTRTA